MRTKCKSIIARILLAAVLVLAVLGIAACGGGAAEAPVVSGVTLTAAAGATRGEVNNEHILSYSATEGSEIVVTVQKDGTAASSAEYTYTAATNTIVFHAEGTYTITVRAELHNKVDEGSISITVGAVKNATVTQGEPVISLTVGGKNVVSVDEGSTVPVVSHVAYDPTDVKQSETFDVMIYNGTQFESAPDAAGESYEWVGEGNTSFRPILPGLYRIEMTVVSAKGTVKKSVGVEVTAAQLELAIGGNVPLANGRVRLLKETSSSIAYTVKNASGEDAYLGNYDISVACDDENVTVNVDEDEKVISVSSEHDSTASVTLQYVHKSVASAKYTLTVPVSFVSDLENAPMFGADPFGGTHGTLIASTGLMLYFDATAADGTPLTYGDIAYDIVDDKTELTNEATASIGNIDANRSFVLVKDFSKNGTGNNATGKVAVKITATVGSYSVSAIKVFNVQALLGNAAGNPEDATGLNDYIADIYDLGSVNFDEITGVTVRENMVVSKEGVYVHRSNGSWDFTNASIFCVDVYKLNNFQMDFTYTVLGRQATSGDKTNKVSFNMNFRTGNFDGYCGSQTAFYAENTATTISAGYWGAGDTDWCENEQKPMVEIGKTYHIRLTHTVDDGKAHFVFQWSADGETYTDWIKYDVSTSGEAGNIGAPVQAIQFNHEAGCYLLGGVTITEL